MILRSGRETSSQRLAELQTELQTKRRRKKKNWDVFLFHLECESSWEGAVRLYGLQEKTEAQTRFALGNHIYVTNTNGEAGSKN